MRLQPPPVRPRQPDVLARQRRQLLSLQLNRHQQRRHLLVRLAPERRRRPAAPSMPPRAPFTLTSRPGHRTLPLPQLFVGAIQTQSHQRRLRLRRKPYSRSASPPINIARLAHPSTTAVLADAAQINTFEPPASRSNPMLEEFYYVDETTNPPNGHFRHDHSPTSSSATATRPRKNGPRLPGHQPPLGQLRPPPPRHPNPQLTRPPASRST